MPVELSLGRKSTQSIVVNDKLAEDCHAVMEVRDDGSVWIRDLGSRYGILVNNQSVHFSRLNPGDILQIGFTKVLWENYLSREEIAEPAKTEKGEEPKGSALTPESISGKDELVAGISTVSGPPARVNDKPVLPMAPDPVESPKPVNMVDIANTASIQESIFERILFNHYTLLLLVLITMGICGWLAASFLH